MIKMVEEKNTQGDDSNLQKAYSERQLVVFSLGNEEFGVDINEVNSIIKMTPITRIPNAQSFIEGVINLRGRIIVVVDLAKKLGLPGKERDKDTRIIVVETNENMVGMIVDHSREAIRVSEDQIEPAPPLITQKISSDYLEGVAIVSSASKNMEQGQNNSTKENDRLLILLDLAKVLNSDEMASVQRTQSSASVSADSPKKDTAANEKPEEKSESQSTQQEKSDSPESEEKSSTQ